VTITGRGFGSTRGLVLIGTLTYKPGDPRISSWSNTRVVFKLPAYKAWPPGTSHTKNIKVKAGPAGNRVTSNVMPLTITKP